LVGEAENGDRAVRRQALLRKIREPADAVAIRRVGRLGDEGGRAETAGQGCERDVVAWEARPAVADRSAEVLAADAGVEADCSGDDVDVGAGETLADPGEH